MNLHIWIWLIGLPVAFMLELIRRRFHNQRTLPLAKTAPACRTERYAETLLLGCVCSAIWLFTATNGSMGGRLFYLEQFPPALVRIDLLTAILSLAVLLVGWGVSLCGSVRQGTILCAMAMVLYATLLNGPGNLLYPFAPEQARQPRVNLSFHSGVSDLQGAELYVNGVYLGDLPFSIEKTEFVEKVPVWEQEPPRPDLSEIPEQFMEYSRPSNGYGSRVHSLYRPIRLDIPDRRTAPEYYAQVKHQGQWCYWTGRGGSDGGGGRYIQKLTYTLNFLSPDRELQLEALLGQARLRDYRVSKSWFEAMETLGRDGVVALLKAEPHEPEVTQLLDDWAAQRYGLDAVRDEATAWLIFEDLCRELKEAQAYSTEGLEGRATAWLAPKLPLDRLVRYAGRLIRQTDLISWTQWQVGGKTHFGCRYEGARFIMTEGGTSYQRGGIPARQCPIESCAVAHALWVRFEQGDPPTLTALQDRMVPEIMAKFYEELFRLPFLCAIGGSTLERFLLRQDWQMPADKLPWRRRTQVHRADVNGWFWMLTHLDTPAGAQFRRRYRERVYQLADEVDGDIDFGDLSFLFLDLEPSSDSLAVQYWPRFQKRLEDGPRHSQAEQSLRYLLAMEPQTPVSMYGQVAQGHSMSVTALGSAHDLLRQLPASKRQSVYWALHAIYEGDISHLNMEHYDQENARLYLLSSLDTALMPDALQAWRLYEKLAKKEPVGMALKWLQYTRPDHELVALLARSDQPELRLKALPAMGAHPSKRNRELLETLTGDPDEKVQQAALEVKQQWQELAQQSPVEMVHQVSGEDLWMKR